MTTEEMLAAMEAAENELPEAERLKRRHAGERRRALIDDAGSYRRAIRSADGRDAVERRAA